MGCQGTGRGVWCQGHIGRLAGSVGLRGSRDIGHWGHLGAGRGVEGIKGHHQKASRGVGMSGLHWGMAGSVRAKKPAEV